VGCVHFRENEYAYCTNSGTSTYKCAACSKTLRSQRNEDASANPRSSTLDLPKKIVSPERTLVMPPVFNSDKREVLSIQQETVRLRGVCTIDLIQLLLDPAHELGEDVALLKSDSISLISQINKLHVRGGHNLRNHCPSESVC
jgi:hypothetical protein